MTLAADGFTPLHALTKDNAPMVTGVRYAFADRRNGWYAYAVDAEGNQIGAAAYEYCKANVLLVAREVAKDLNVEVRRA